MAWWKRLELGVRERVTVWNGILYLNDLLDKFHDDCVLTAEHAKLTYFKAIEKLGYSSCSNNLVAITAAPDCWWLAKEVQRKITSKFGDEHRGAGGGGAKLLVVSAEAQYAWSSNCQSHDFDECCWIGPLSQMPRVPLPTRLCFSYMFASDDHLQSAVKIFNGCAHVCSLLGRCEVYPAPLFSVASLTSLRASLIKHRDTLKTIRDVQVLNQIADVFGTSLRPERFSFDSGNLSIDQMEKFEYSTTVFLESWRSSLVCLDVAATLPSETVERREELLLVRLQALTQLRSLFVHQTSEDFLVHMRSFLVTNEHVFDKLAVLGVTWSQLCRFSRVGATLQEFFHCCKGIVLVLDAPVENCYEVNGILLALLDSNTFKSMMRVNWDDDDDDDDLSRLVVEKQLYSRDTAAAAVS